MFSRKKTILETGLSIKKLKKIKKQIFLNEYNNIRITFGTKKKKL